MQGNLRILERKENLGEKLEFSVGWINKTLKKRNVMKKLCKLFYNSCLFLYGTLFRFPLNLLLKPVMTLKF